MKLRLTFLAAFVFSFVATAFAQNAKIEGHVIDQNGRPVIGVRVKAPFLGQATTTDGKGHFVIYFAVSVQPGGVTRIQVERSGWVIYEPNRGNCTIQDSTKHFEPLRVKIVPKRSNLLRSDRSLSNLVDKMPVEYAKERNKRIDLERELNEERKRQKSASEQLSKTSGEVGRLRDELKKFTPINDFADETGFTPEEVVAALLRWARITKATDDKLDLIRKAFVLKNNDLILQLTAEAIPDARKILKQKNQESLKTMRDYVHLVMYQANALYGKGEYEEALNSYHAIELGFETGELSRELLREEWADLGLMIGDAAHQLGTRIQGIESAERLRQALAAYRQAESFYTRERSLRDWAATQNGLANVLGDLGERMEGSEGIRKMQEGASLLRNVISTTSPQQFADVWAATQNHLGSVLRDLGERVGGDESLTHLKDAKTAFSAAQTVFVRDKFPQHWAVVQNNLGNTLNSMGELMGGSEGLRYLKEAEAVFGTAIEIITREQSPQGWAMLQNNLGLVLESLGERVEGVDGIKYLERAEKTYRNALEVRTRERMPQKWAATQMNLGNTLRELSSQMEGADRIKILNDAEEALRAAIEVFTRDQFPQDWAAAQSNLGPVLALLGTSAEGSASLRYLKEAESVLRLALEVRTQEHLPQKWATTQNSLGAVYSALGARIKGIESINYWKNAEAAMRAALRVRTRDHLPQRWAATQNNLGLVLINLGARTNGQESLKYLNEAQFVLLAALEVRTRQNLPQKWAMTQMNLADVYLLLKNWVAASEAYSNVLQVFPNRLNAYRGATSLDHEVLFRFDRAFATHQQWLAKNGDDVDALADFAEANFTTARFSECNLLISALLTRQEVSVSTKTALRAIEIASLLALSKSTEVLGKLDVLMAEISRQPAEFTVEWRFDGTKHFLSQNDKLSSHRVWLGQLFDALSGEGRDEILKALQKVKVKFKE